MQPTSRRRRRKRWQPSSETKQPVRLWRLHFGPGLRLYPIALCCVLIASCIMDFQKQTGSVNPLLVEAAPRALNLMSKMASLAASTTSAPLVKSARLVAYSLTCPPEASIHPCTCIYHNPAAISDSGDEEEEEVYEISSAITTPVTTTTALPTSASTAPVSPTQAPVPKANPIQSIVSNEHENPKDIEATETVAPSTIPDDLAVSTASGFSKDGSDNYLIANSSTTPTMEATTETSTIANTPVAAQPPMTTVSPIVVEQQSYSKQVASTNYASFSTTPVSISTTEQTPTRSSTTTTASVLPMGSTSTTTATSSEHQSLPTAAPFASSTTTLPTSASTAPVSSTQAPVPKANPTQSIVSNEHENPKDIEATTTVAPSTIPDDLAVSTASGFSKDGSDNYLIANSSTTPIMETTTGTSTTANTPVAAHPPMTTVSPIVVAQQSYSKQVASTNYASSSTTPVSISTTEQTSASSSTTTTASALPMSSTSTTTATWSEHRSSPTAAPFASSTTALPTSASTAPVSPTQAPVPKTNPIQSIVSNEYENTTSEEIEATTTVAPSTGLNYLAVSTASGLVKDGSDNYSIANSSTTPTMEATTGTSTTANTPAAAEPPMTTVSPIVVAQQSYSKQVASTNYASSSTTPVSISTTEQTSASSSTTTTASVLPIGSTSTTTARSNHRSSPTAVPFASSTVTPKPAASAVVASTSTTTVKPTVSTSGRPLARASDRSTSAAGRAFQARHTSNSSSPGFSLPSLSIHHQTSAGHPAPNAASGNRQMLTPNSQRFRQFGSPQRGPTFIASSSTTTSSSSSTTTTTTTSTPKPVIHGAPNHEEPEVGQRLPGARRQTRFLANDGYLIDGLDQVEQPKPEVVAYCRNIQNPQVLREAIRGFRGHQINYFVIDSCKVPPFPNDLFVGIDVRWLEMSNSTVQFHNNFLHTQHQHQSNLVR